MFRSGVDYWARRRHLHHSWKMREVVFCALLVQQRTSQPRDVHAGGLPAVIETTCPHMPVELWFLIYGFLRSADFDEVRLLDVARCW